MSTSLVTPPTSEPVDIAEVKSHLNLLNDDHDTYLDTLIVAARRQCEVITHQAAIQTTYRRTLSCWPANGVIELEHPPLQSIVSIKYIDTDGTERALPVSEYVEKTDSMPGCIVRAYGASWPAVRTSGVASPITVEYIAGHATASDVPQEFKQAMLLMIGHWWMVRESVAQVEFSEVPMSAKSLLACAWHGGYP